MFLHDTPQVYSSTFFASALISQPLSHLLVLTCQIVFHKKPRIPLNLHLNFSRHRFRDCIAKYCSDLAPRSYYKPTDLFRCFIASR